MILVKMFQINLIILHCFRFSFALLLAGCAVDSINHSSSQMSVDKLDLLMDKIMSMQDQIRSVERKLNLINASVSLPEDVLPFRAGGSEASLPRFELLGSPYLGDASAEIAIVEFTDYECPFCRRHFDTTYQQLKENFVEAGLVRYYIVDFPLAGHAFALPSAVAARCAGEQGKFWEYHDALFSLESSLFPEVFDEIAHSLNLPAENFSVCMASPDHRAHIELLVSQAEQIGVGGTPTFLIGEVDRNGLLENGMLLHGAKQYTDFDDLISFLLL